MGCFLIITENDFRMIRSSFGNKVHYLSHTASGYFVEIAGDAAQATKEIAEQIRRNFPETDSDQVHLHHLIPQQAEIKDFFRKLEIDIDDYTVPIPSRDHIGKTGMHNDPNLPYNNYWLGFIKEHEGKDPELIRGAALMCIVQCMSAYNIDFDTTVRYKK